MQHAKIIWIIKNKLHIVNNYSSLVQLSEITTKIQLHNKIAMHLHKKMQANEILSE